MILDAAGYTDIPGSREERKGRVRSREGVKEGVRKGKGRLMKEGC